MESGEATLKDKSKINESSMSSGAILDSDLTSYLNGTSGLECEPIAIVGLACRLPGAVDTPSQLWRLLIDGRSGHGEIPKQRFNAPGFYHPDSSRPGSLPSVGGYFLHNDVRRFDNTFFGINNLEAKHIDPQQRQLLEVVYECLENGGQSLDRISGSNTGCYVANFTNDYSLMQYKDVEYSSHYSGTGAAVSILANRLSNVFDLHGPSSVTDTACSSSLYSLHSACIALYGRECDAAIVASANLIQSPEQHLQAVKAGILSSDSTCHTFDARANGYGRAEGVNALYLKRLRDALRDRDPIRSIIRGTAVNSNGKTTGMSLPSAQFQASVIRKAYARAQLPFQDTQYVEAHGTGTPVGDPIEVEGLLDTFGPRACMDKLLVGSIKTNIGHSEGASGLSSIIKVVLALENGLIPPTIGIANLNPRLEAFSEQMTIVDNVTTWPTSSIRRAGVSSFGFGGANAHVILDSALGYTGQLRLPDPLDDRSKKCVIPFSASTEPSLLKWIERLSYYVMHSEYDIEDLVYTLSCKRTHLSIRSYIIASKEEVGTICKTRSPRVQRTALQSQSENGSIPVVFIFTGQGAQWPRMAAGLIERFPVFQRTVHALDAILKNLAHPPPWTLSKLLEGQTGIWDINSAEISQPLCTALQIALVDLLKDWHVEPAIVVGYSSGEIAAAYCVEALDAKEAILVAYYRGLVASTSTESGAMAAVGLGQSAVNNAISRERLHKALQLACINSSESVTVSGDADAVAVLVERLQAQKVFARMLETGGRAYHSRHMVELGGAYENLLQQLPWEAKSKSSRGIRIVSSMNGRDISHSVLRSAKYWRGNLESPVNFEAAIKQIVQGTKCSFLELGPHHALKIPLKQIQSAESTAIDGFLHFSTLLREQPPVDSLLRLAGGIYMSGYPISMENVNALRAPTTLVDLPNYAWHHEDLLWSESRISKEFRDREYPRHYLLGSRLPGGSGIVWSWRNVLRPCDVPWIQDHKVGDAIVLPAAAFINIAIEALRQHEGLDLSTGIVVLRNMKINKALIIPDDDIGIETVTDFQALPLSSSARSGKHFTFEISSFAESTPVSHAVGRISFECGRRDKSAAPFDSEAFHENHAMEAWYDGLATAGLKFGPSFQVLKHVHSTLSNGNYGISQAIADVVSHDSINHQAAQSEDSIHASLLDSLLQVSIISNAGGSLRNTRARVPVSIEEVYLDLTRKASSGIARAQSEFRGCGVTQNTASFTDRDAHLICQMDNIRLLEYSAVNVQLPPQQRNPILRVKWLPDISLLRPEQSSQFKRYLSDTFATCTSAECSHGLLQRTLDSLQPTGGLQRLQSVTVAQSGSKRFSGKTFEDIPVEVPEIEFMGDGKLDRSLTFDVVIELTGLNLQNKPTDLRSEKSNLKLGPNNIFLSVSENLTEDDTTDDLSILLHETFDGPSGIPHRLKLSRLRTSEPDRKPATHPPQISYVFRKFFSPQDDAIIQGLRCHFGVNVQASDFDTLDTLDPGPNAIIIFAVECQRAILPSLSSVDLSRIQKLMRGANTLVWLTSGALIEASQPSLALAPGLSRAVMLEQPALKFYIIDVGTDELEETQETCHNLFSVLQKGSSEQDHDYELVQKNGILYSSRFVPDEEYNSDFRSRQGRRTKTTSLKNLGNCELVSFQTGQIDSLGMRVVHDSGYLRDGSVEVETKAVGLNFKDLSIVESSIDTRHGNCALESSGVVKANTASGSDLNPGDRVVVMAPQRIRTTAIYPDWACVKLLDSESFSTVCTLPLVFSTAIHALQSCAKIEEGDSVLIHSAASGLGQAAIQIAQLAKAKIFATVGTDQKKEFLASKYSLDPGQIFSSLDDSFCSDIHTATRGRGVDIVLNTLTGDLLHASLQCCAEFARYIEVGRRDIQQFGQLDMSVFNRNISITAFDLSHLYYSTQPRYQQTWAKLLRETMNLFRENKIHPIEPLITVDIADAPKAFRALQSRTRMGKVALSFENRDSVVEYEPSRYDTVLDPEKHYLMFGALGGLGRSIAKWMFQRGARRFTFLNRSGLEKPKARSFVAELESQGAEITVIKGSVDVESDVREAVITAQCPIGGVIHAAMGLDEALFSDMTVEQWNKAIRPKVDGTWNIHHALSAHEQSLDFFLLTSSISGSVGTATESNYCAANSFQDAFARYRRSLGWKAVSIGFGMISEVGYLHEHPDIEKLLLRKGIHPITEDECLQIVDIAISKESQVVHDSSHLNALAPKNGHMLSGLELVSLDSQRELGFEGHSHVLDDPRSSLLAYNYFRQHKQQHKKVLAPGQSEALDLDTDDLESLRASVSKIVTQKVANLVLVPAEGLHGDTHLSEFGMDSMLAAEFRGHVFQVLGVDVSFMTILGTATTIDTITDLIMEQLERRRAAGSSASD